MDKLYAAAADSGLTFKTSPTTDGIMRISLQDYYDGFLITLNQAANMVYQKTRRIRPNFVVCGTDVATIISSIRTFKPSGEAAVAGPYFLGTVGQFKVYVSPDLPTTSWTLGYKGNTLLDAGFIYAPYMPVTTVAAAHLEDLMGRKGWATMYGTRLVNDKMYIKGSIVKN